MKTVAIDIETTGLAATDEVTVVGLGDDETYEIHYNADGGRTHVDQDEFEWESNDREIELYGWPSEERLLTRLNTAVNRFELNIEGTLLVGFNVDGFDFPMMRTRSMVNDVPWPFSGCQYLDVQNAFKYDLQTKKQDIMGFNKGPLKEFGDYVDANYKASWRKEQIKEAIHEKGFETADVMDFAGENGYDNPTNDQGKQYQIHQLYCELGVLDDHPHDPLGHKSELCVSRWAEGDMESIIQHNLADLKMTLDLVGLLPAYIHESELRTTRL
ncbi:hypothetical protein HUG10_20510 (plasmid) [Halorarum halophilum]|uniref:Uncharacterized protein n=1 Tax=Halorarum halophilum TaxID=2743090 RepID=A0A7D5GES9_9EURY|nr:hypothetical protein [Halobaculum halophilum]QLG29992.1 hypothetical protein HUG10_20510 [Halobaculum halophilum]